MYTFCMVIGGISWNCFGFGSGHTVSPVARHHHHHRHENRSLSLFNPARNTEHYCECLSEYGKENAQCIYYMWQWKHIIFHTLWIIFSLERMVDGERRARERQWCIVMWCISSQSKMELRENHIIPHRLFILYYRYICMDVQIRSMFRNCHRSHKTNSDYDTETLLEFCFINLIKHRFPFDLSIEEFELFHLLTCIPLIVH